MKITKTWGTKITRESVERTFLDFMIGLVVISFLILAYIWNRDMHRLAEEVHNDLQQTTQQP